MQHLLILDGGEHTLYIPFKVLQFNLRSLYYRLKPA